MYERRVFDRYLTVKEERQLLTTVSSFRSLYARRDHGWMRLLRHSGIRLKTLHGLTVQDAKNALREGYLHIRVEINKGRKSGSIYLNAKSRRALKYLLAIRRKMGYAEMADEPLVMSRNHKAMSIRSYQARMQEWCEKAGLDVQASPHWWRHTLAKRVMSQSTAKDPRGIVQRALLHSNINTTAIYTMPDREDYETAMEEAA